MTRFQPYLSLFPEEMLTYLYSLPAWIFVIWGIGIGAGLLGGILLLMRRKLAALLLGVSLIGPALSLALPFVKPMPEGVGDPYSAVLITGFAVLLFIYALWMSRRGKLR